MNRPLVVVAALMGLSAVGLGAFGAHALAEMLDQKQTTAVFETAVQYHFYHALAMFAAAWVASQRRGITAVIAGWCFAAGIGLFCGSIYLLALTTMKWPGPVTPVGGVLFMVGWALLAVAALRAKGDG